MTGPADSPSFRLAYVPGVTPTKWVRTWNERLPDVPLTLVQVPAAEAAGLLRDRGADAGLLRLPVDRTVLSAIPLYTEATVVVVPRDHVLTVVEEVATEDLAEEIVLHPLDEVLDWEHRPGRPALERPASTADAVALVAAGVGVLVVPQSLARLHHRKDLTYRPVTDAPRSGVALSWPEEATTDLVDDFIGIVRGRTVNSTRGRAATRAQDGPSGRGSAEGAPPGREAKESGGQARGGRPGAARRGSRGGGPRGGGRGGRAGGGRSGKRGGPRRRG
ncbi:LysR family transcriptional regulator [Streptomyces sp. AJS327]|uniref:LysR substrate-binding domain-containing protein n=1 Tax=Streptomyces sp. AJS327 TaxID=2545265 RepID=UPI0015DFE613|nr:LysR substrate-binding domain-containing protein [Streptomyces sp. AJS327]MBA0052506.1 LysR family transcriptional regulator [Streptomyces sp. AJS327]